MAWTFRTMIVSDAVVDTCRSLAQLLAGEGQVLWTTPLSADGAEPATHWISSGLIDESFALLMPLQEWTWVIDDEETGAGHWEETVISSGEPAVIYAMYTQAIDPDLPAFTEQDVADMLAASDVTTEDPYAAMDRLGLQMVQEDFINDGV